MNVYFVLVILSYSNGQFHCAELYSPLLLSVHCVFMNVSIYKHARDAECTMRSASKRMLGSNVEESGLCF